MQIQPLIQTDFYKQSHYKMYPNNTSLIYSNLTPRKSRIDGVDKIVFFGLQYFIKEYLINQWNEQFFKKPWNEIKDRYLRIINNTLGKDAITIDHIKQLHDLQYLPLVIKALPEGSYCPMRFPCLTIRNTDSRAYWLVNFLETIISCVIWQPSTSATIAAQYKKLANQFADETVGNRDMVQWLFHDFSMRGMSSLESACTSGAAHLLSFTGTDTIPAIQFLEDYYNANSDKELVGASVPATEHSIMSIGFQDGEIETFSRLLDQFPTGILSVVSDTWSLPAVITKILPKLKDKIMAREGKLVIRPDSFWTDPVDCLCGFDGNHVKMNLLDENEKLMVRKGVIESLWDIFGGTKTEKGYKLLDPHIGAIYGDSITLDRAKESFTRLRDKGFASINSVYGVGSYSYQYNTRDTLGFAIKATYGVVDNIARAIFKDPVTDDGMKKSAKGLLRVNKKDGEFILKDECTWEEESGGELNVVFHNGVLVKDFTLKEIRENLNNSL